ncbi:cytochrome C [Pseudohalocynthiibacter aestuariivivens]|nr:cytochrome C [Pseudohalocynthiibacter aestuariivivens]QIE44629.1 cytochrome C [Pseudohalocynthiibacter aestuariivivens]
MNKIITAAAALMLVAPAHAENHETTEMAAPSGDVAAGEKAFRQCVSCHIVKNDAGELLAGSKARSGPNLYGAAGHQIAGRDDYKYGPSIAKLGADGMIWDEESFVAYVQDPTGWLRETLGDPDAKRSKMTFKVRKADNAVDLYAFLYSLKPPVKEEKAE